MSEESVALALKAIREGLGVGLREMARRVNMSPSSYSHYENPNRFKAPYLPMAEAKRFAVALGRDGEPEARVLELATSQTLDGAGRPPAATIKASDQEEPALVRIYDVNASAGGGAVVPDYEAVASQLAFPPGYLRTITSSNPQNLQVISVVGRSMIPTVDHEDLVMIDRSKTNLGYDGVFVLLMDGTLHVKRVTRGSAQGQVRIVSDNATEFPAFERRIEDIEVLGKVVWAGRRM
ncbi:LexA family transcriptional regulator [Cereibacter sphaeroides]|uniref:LexA family transcriptional regulator n=1 Tax=Cereibacter sphaeroides TaxID=1063 RepID=UPI003FCE9F6A